MPKIIHEDITPEEFYFLTKYRLFRDLMEPGDHIYIMTSEFTKSQIQSVSKGLEAIAEIYNEIDEV